MERLGKLELKLHHHFAYGDRSEAFQDIQQEYQDPCGRPEDAEDVCRPDVSAAVFTDVNAAHFCDPEPEWQGTDHVGAGNAD